MDERTPFYSTAVHLVASNHNGSTLTVIPSSAPHDNLKIVDDAARTESVPGRHNEDDSAYMQPVEQDCKGEKSNVKEVPDREGLVDTLSEDSSTLPILRKLPITTPRPSLGDRLSLITIAHASLQYLKDRAQSASSLRPVTTAAPVLIMGEEHIENRANDSSSPPLTSRSAHSDCLKASETNDVSSSSCFSGDVLHPADADTGSVINASGPETPNAEAHPAISAEISPAVPSAVSAEGRASALSASPDEVPLVLSPAPSELSVPAITVTGPLDDVTAALPAEWDVLSIRQAREADPAEAHPSNIIDLAVSGSLEAVVSSPASIKLPGPRNVLPVRSMSDSDAVIDMSLDDSFEYTLSASSQSPGDEPAASVSADGAVISLMNFDATPSSECDSHPFLPAVSSDAFHSCEDRLGVCASPRLSQASRCPESPSAIPVSAGSTVDTILPASYSLDKPLLPPDELMLPGDATHPKTEYAVIALSSAEDTIPDDDANGTNEELSFGHDHGVVTSGIREDSLPPVLDEAEDILVRKDSMIVDVTHTKSAAAPSVTSTTPFGLVEDMTIPPASVGATEGDIDITTASSAVDVQKCLISENYCSAGVADESREAQDVTPDAEHLVGSSKSAADDRTSYDTVTMQVDCMTELPAELSMDVSTDEPDCADDDLGPTSSPFPPSSPLYLSSPVRSSSPPFVFSSPPQKGLSTSPPSSPLPVVEQVSFCLDEGPRTRNEDASTTVQKRALEDVDGPDGIDSCGLLGPNSSVPRAKDAKRMKLDLEESSIPITPLPQPKRPTFASQLRERKKLAAPFRSPLVDKNAVRHGVDAVYATSKGKKYMTTKRDAEVQIDSLSASQQPAPARTGDTSMGPKAARDYSRSVAKQFKLPFHSGSSSSSTQPAFSTIQAIPTIRALQAEIQTLKQAVRIKTASDCNDDDDLEALANKWTTVGREVAWAVWDTVKDLDPGETVPMGRVPNNWFGDDGGSRDSWRNRGWGFDDRWGQPAEGANEDEGQADTKDNDGESHVKHTLGTMLRHLGIAPETLGWDDEEGDFVDVESRLKPRW